MEKKGGAGKGTSGYSRPVDHLMEFCVFVGIAVYSIAALLVLYLLVDRVSEKMFSVTVKRLETLDREISKLDFKLSVLAQEICNEERRKGKSKTEVYP